MQAIAAAHFTGYSIFAYLADNESNKFWNDYVSRYTVTSVSLMCWFCFEKNIIHDQWFAPPPPANFAYVRGLPRLRAAGVVGSAESRNCIMEASSCVDARGHAHDDRGHHVRSAWVIASGSAHAGSRAVCPEQREALVFTATIEQDQSIRVIAASPGAGGDAVYRAVCWISWKGEKQNNNNNNTMSLRKGSAVSFRCNQNFVYL